MTFNSKFAFEELLYLRTAKERRPGMVIKIFFMPDQRPGQALYEISWGNATNSIHFECELTREFVPDFNAD
jgi:hypothetical protein